MSMGCVSGSRPASRTRSRARSTIRIGSPMSSTNRSPQTPSAAASTISPGGLGNRHEVPRHLGMRDRQRLALLELVLEERDHAAARSENVAEPNRIRTTDQCAAAASATSISGDALAGTHHARRPNGLVCRHENEAPDVGSDCRIQQGEGPADVHVNGVRGMLLEHRNVLVGSRVEDHVGLLVRHETIHRGPARDVREVRPDRPPGPDRDRALPRVHAGRGTGRSLPGRPGPDVAVAAGRPDGRARNRSSRRRQ